MQNSRALLKAKAAAELELRRRNLLGKTYQEWLNEIPNCKFNWQYPHIKKVANAIDQIVYQDKPKKIMVFMPPQHGKSTVISKHFPVYFLSKDPSKRVIIGTYNYGFASEFCRDIRRLLTDKGYAYFGDKVTANAFETSTGGFVKAFGMQSGITGTAADLVIIDDPTKSFEEAYSSTIRDKIFNAFCFDIETREQKNTSYIIVMTRWHKDDLVGRLLERDGDNKWEIISFPAICETENDELGRKLGDPLCPELHTLERLLERKKANPMLFQSLYQQQPTLQSGNILKNSYFVILNDEEEPSYEDYDYTVISIDAAAKTAESNDYSIALVFAFKGDKYFLIDMFRGKVVYSDLRSKLIQLSAKYNPQIVLIEDTSNGIPLCQELSSKLPISPIKLASTDKEQRAHIASVKLEAQPLYVYSRDWTYDFINEVTNFPKAKNDDIVDALTQFVRHASVAKRSYTFGIDYV